MHSCRIPGHGVTFLIGFILSAFLFACDSGSPETREAQDLESLPMDSSFDSGPRLLVLGVAQDGGMPHMGCKKACCRNPFLRSASARSVVSLGLVDDDGVDAKGLLFEATPQLTQQWDVLSEWGQLQIEDVSIFLTHAHIGHYSGLMFLGREAMGANAVPVFVMPKFRAFLQSNGPWNQLVELGNIVLRGLKEGETLQATSRIDVTPLTVPHRDEYSETVGFRVQGPKRSFLFIPDINKWDEWDRTLRDELSRVDRAYIDATFFDASEVGHRDMSEIPHPFMVETMGMLDSLPEEERNKVHFIHMNHTNPCLNPESDAFEAVIQAGYHIAQEGDEWSL